MLCLGFAFAQFSELPASMSPSSLKTCFNPDCKETKLELPKNGWRLRSGEFAELCNRCGFAFEEGRFCETFHLNAAGWRSCESCKKRFHCGCVVSAHGYVLLDAGGIECIPCAKKNVLLTPNSVWPASLFNPVPLSERLKDFSLKNWGQISGSGSVRPWLQTPSFGNASAQLDLHPRAYGVDLSSSHERLANKHPLLENKKITDLSERMMNGSLNLGVPEKLENGNAGIDFEEQPYSYPSRPQFSLSKDDCSAPHFTSSVPPALPNGANGQMKRVNTHLQKPTPSPPSAKEFRGNSHSGFEGSSENHTHNGRPRGDGRGKYLNLLPRYWPKITDEELQQISGDSNAIITPLFEKTLSASDAGRVGRLVLPKKCAEAYFPPISQPEGLPINVQDLQGQEWTFQFRFWPNNNSRMYVLEGVTPCIQSMKLQAGDTVTFSRLEPEGKLVMGCRKAWNPSSQQGNHTVGFANGALGHGDVNSADPASAMDVSEYTTKEVPVPKPFHPKKRKNSSMGLKNKRLRIDSEEMLEIKLTWEEAQGLLRPPCNRIPSVIVIEGFEFEEYEDAPTLGRPTIFAVNPVGDGVQWAQCEDCLKWRKIPADALLPSKWTCSDNLWDPERSKCSAGQELTTEQLEDMLSTSITADTKKMKAVKQDLDTFEPLEGLDTLANLAILGEGEGLPPSGQATTKHPRHRPGCTCIVCIQPPSGSGPRHKQTCTCNVCLTVKRRFRTLMMRREKKLSEKEADSMRKKLQEESSLPEKVLEDGSLILNTESSSPDNKVGACEENLDEPSRTKSSTSPFKGQIDLNIQPEREEELSPGSDSSCMIQLLQDTDRLLKEQKFLSSCSHGDPIVSQTLPGKSGPGSENLSNGIILLGNKQEDNMEHI